MTSWAGLPTRTKPKRAAEGLAIELQDALSHAVRPKITAVERAAIAFVESRPGRAEYLGLGRVESDEID